MRPMKLLVCAMRTASLTLIAFLPPPLALLGR